MLALGLQVHSLARKQVHFALNVETTPYLDVVPGNIVANDSQNICLDDNKIVDPDDHGFVVENG